eukprot:10586835-Lingulodinium_polyedra.AAC.1
MQWANNHAYSTDGGKQWPCAGSVHWKKPNDLLMVAINARVNFNNDANATDGGNYKGQEPCERY